MPFRGGFARVMAHQGIPSDAEKWQRIKALFASALERMPAERSSFLAQACAGDESVQAEVESLLASHESADSFVGVPAQFSAAAAAKFARDLPESIIGRRIGAYQIIRQLGRGGMAVVYLGARADDEYRKRVAIKLVLPGLNNEEVLRRFRNERQTLAALDHPNIVKLLDGGSTEEGLPYLVMDYVEGVPIDEYCNRCRLSTTERLQLFSKVCGAVHYAHLNLVVHRDLKPGNILVAADGTPKLLDFGIAKLLNPEFARTLLMTQANLRLMTPEYASPEQVRGEPITPRTDVYSLGVILYELLSGRHPYRLKCYTPLEMEKLICEEEPERPSTAVTRSEEIAGPGDSTVTSITPEQVSRTREGDVDKLRRRLHGDLDVITLTALRKEPGRRYASVKDLSEDIRRHLEHLPIKARPNTVRYRAHRFLRRHKETAVAAVIALVLLSSFIVWQTYRRPVQAPLSAQSSMDTHFKMRPSVAVLGFKNLSGQPDVAWLSTALSEMLTTELSVGEKLRTIPGENVSRMKKDLTLSDADALARDTLLRVRTNVGADLVLLGSYVDLGRGTGGRVRLDLRLQDAKAGETIAAVSDTGTESNLFDLVSRAGAQLRERLGIGEVTPAEAANVKAALPAKLEAARQYAEGLAKLRVFDALAARELLEKAIFIDPVHALAHSALAAAWSQLGYDEKVKDEAQTAFHFSANLSREYRLLVEGQYRETTKEWNKAAEIYRTLHSLFPDSLEYGLRLANAEVLEGKGKDALATIERLRRLPAPARDDPRIDLAEALAANTLSDFQRQQSVAHKAADKAAADGASALVARAEISEGTAFLNLAQLDQAAQAYAKARDLSALSGDLGTMARALQSIGNVLKEQGKLADARQLYEQALATYRKLGYQRGVAAVLGNIGNVLTDQGDLAGAHRMHARSLATYREIGDKLSTANELSNTAVVLEKLGDSAGAMKMYEQALAIDREIDNQRQAAIALNNIAGVLNTEGNLAAARSKFDEALAIRRHLGNTKDVGISLTGLAEVAFSEGDLANASRMLQEALAMFRDNGYKSGAAYDLFDLGQIFSAQANLSAARASYAEALSIRSEIGEKETTAETQLALAQLAIDEGHPSDAIGAVNNVRAEFQTEKNIDGEMLTDTVLARALLAQRLFARAQQEIDAGTRLAAKSRDLQAQLDFAIVRARVRATLGRSAEAKAALETALSRARKLGFVALQFEARLALGEIEVGLQHRNDSQRRLRELQKDSRTRGYELIARKAAALMLN